MEVEDVGWTPQARAAAIHRQLGDMPAPIPVHEIARALDIDEIYERPLRNFEGCLATDPERSAGEILVNSRSSYARRRYTVAHELGHFLCGWHQSTYEGGFRCSQRDMIVSREEGAHERQEAEANRFAIELLAPEYLLKRHLRRLPELERVIAIGSEHQISKTAAARRYVDLHADTLAVVFSQHDRFIYAHRGAAFPWLPFVWQDRLPELPSRAGGDPFSEMVEADQRDWLKPGATCELALQVLRQEEGHAIILLQASEA